MTAELLTSMVLAAAFLSGTGLILSAFLILAERKILNYGTCKISVNDGFSYWQKERSSITVPARYRLTTAKKSFQ
jgi:Na+-transporting NADH:ubiquinone oxidoreductase subunit NqrF